MKVFIAVLVLIFSLQSWTKADDIRDFQIEGISIGDSLLDYFSEEEIKKSIAKKQHYKDNSFVRGYIRKSLKEYDSIQFHFKKNDKDYILYMMSGILDFPNKIDECNSKRLQIISDLKTMFNDVETKSEKEKHPQDKSNKSYVYTHYFYLKSGDAIRVQCYDWSKKSGFFDHLKVTLDSVEYIDWMKNKAWE